MSGHRVPGPLCSEVQPWSILDGTSALWRMPAPTPVCVASLGSWAGLASRAPAVPDLGILFHACQGRDYAVFDYREDGQRRAGVRVTTADAKEREIACTGRVTSRVIELKGVLKCDADSALNGGSCP